MTTEEMAQSAASKVQQVIVLAKTVFQKSSSRVLSLSDPGFRADMEKLKQLVSVFSHLGMIW